MSLNKKIIINADDFGLNESVNDAIVESFKSGFINSATLMANMPGFDEAVSLIHEWKLEEKIGVHLVVTEGKALTEDAENVDFLFNKNALSGKLRIKKLFILDKQSRKIIFNEFSAQIEKVKRNGILITHLDTHHQVHDMWGIMQILLELLKTYRIPAIRILNNLEKSQYFYKNEYRHIINNYLKFLKVDFTDYFGNQFDFSSKFKNKSVIFDNKRVEIMVHPVYNQKGLLVDKIRDLEPDFKFIDSFKI